jgi:hypothetical protein
MSLLVQLTHMMAAGWCFYEIFVTPDFLQKLFQKFVPEGVHDRKAATIKIVETFFKDNSENMTRRPK